MKITSLFLIVALLLGGCGGGGSSSGSSTAAPAPTSTSNNKPTAVISFVSNGNVLVGDEVSFSGGSSSDPDGNTPLTYQWIFSGAATSILESTAVNPGSVRFNETGTVSITLVVTDSLGLASDT